MSKAREILSHATFFEGLDNNHVQALADMAQTQHFKKGERIIEEGAEACACFVLISGRVALTFRHLAGDPRSDSGNENQFAVRDYADIGRFLGWSALIPPFRYRGSVTALEPTEMVVLRSEAINAYLRNNPAFGVKVIKRVIWVLGSRLRETRIRLVARRYDNEVAAISALLEQSAPQLNIDSPLHKIPYYLENRLTLGDAFQVLDVLLVQGTPREQDLAALSLDILGNVRKELKLYQDLQRVYETVASASSKSQPDKIRELCCLRFCDVFENTSYVIKGEENLPDKPGFIVVMNHLVNHPDNTLPNTFQLTLDTHFVSAMILYRKYKEAPIRIIRKSKRNEFGHQKYYDRLGYIYVSSGHVDESIGQPEITAEDRRKFFLDAARNYLQADKNIVICPEGTSVSTEDSPVSFKTGAFRLAAYVKPEPLIVPIAVANFDKKITRSKVSAIVFEPFYLSDKGLDGSDESLKDFVERYNLEFKGFVQQAIRLTK